MNEYVFNIVLVQKILAQSVRKRFELLIYNNTIYRQVLAHIYFIKCEHVISNEKFCK